MRASHATAMAAGKSKESLCPWLTPPSISVVQEPPQNVSPAASGRESTCINTDDRGVFVIKPPQYPVHILIEKPASDTSGPGTSDDDRYTWARQAELIKATNQVLGAGYLNPGVLSKACKSGEIATNGKASRGSMVNVKSYIVWLGAKRKIPKHELNQVRNAVIGEISERNKNTTPIHVARDQST